MSKKELLANLNYVISYHNYLCLVANLQSESVKEVFKEKCGELTDSANKLIKLLDTKFYDEQ